MFERSDELAGIRPGLLSGPDVASPPRRTTGFASAVWIAAPPERVFDFCLDVESIKAMLPDRAEEAPGWNLEARLGGVYAFRYWVRGIFPLTTVVRIERFDRPSLIVDLQLRGLFRYWRHTHTCASEAQGTLYEDAVEFATRFGPWVDRWLVRRDVAAMFAFRQSRMKELLELPR